jgi:hypothetical protein
MTPRFLTIIMEKRNLDLKVSTTNRLGNRYKTLLESIYIKNYWNKANDYFRQN